MVTRCPRMPRKPFKWFKEFKTLSAEAGFTLTELLVATLLTTGVMGAMYHVYRIQTHSVKLQEGRLEAQEYGRAALDLMVREMRNVGHFPTTITSLTDPLSTCTPLLGGIVTAAAQSFSFNLDADGNGNCGGANERITYAFSGGNITRTTGGGAAESLTDGNATSLQFIYYPAQAGGSPPPYCYAAEGDLVVNGVLCSGIATTNLASIQRVSILLTVQSKRVDSEFGAPFVVEMKSNVDLRNRGL